MSRTLLPLAAVLILILTVCIAAVIGIGTRLPMDAVTISTGVDQGRQQTYFLIDLNVRAVVRSPVTIRSGYFSFVSPGGRHMISTQPPAESVTTVEDVWAHDLISGRSTLVGRVHPPLLSEPLWSSDGRYALLRGLPPGAGGGDPAGALVIDVAAATSRFVALEIGAVIFWGGPRRVLAIESDGIQAIDLPDEAPRRLPVNPPDAGHPVAAASPDSALLAIGRYDDTGDLDIEVVDAASGEIRLHMDGPTRDFGPDWSPDGRWLAYRRFGADGAASLITIDLRSGQEHPIALPEWITDPTFAVRWIAPDRLSVFRVLPGGGDHYLLIVNADGSGRHEWELSLLTYVHVVGERLIYYDSSDGTLNSAALDGDRIGTMPLHIGAARASVYAWVDDGRLLYYDVQMGAATFDVVRLARPGGGIVTVFTPPEIGIGAMIIWR